MASRAELVEIAKELEIEHQGLLMDDLKESIRKECDQRFGNKKLFYGINELSLTLLRFMTEEYDFSIIDKDRNKFNYKRERL